MTAETTANAAILAALHAIQRAAEASQEAGYGSQVLGPLADAMRDLQYALDTAEGRN